MTNWKAFLVAALAVGCQRPTSKPQDTTDTSTNKESEKTDTATAEDNCAPNTTGSGKILVAATGDDACSLAIKDLMAKANGAPIVVGPGASPTAPGVLAIFVNGPTDSAAALTLDSQETLALAAATPADGTWFLSPNKIILTVNRLSLGQVDPGGASLVDEQSSSSQTPVNCTVTYDRALAGLTSLDACIFSASLGTYTTVSASFDSTWQVLIDDPVNGFYSTAAGIVTSPPDGGAQLLSLTTKTITERLSVLSKPFTLVKDAPVPLNMVVNGIQMLEVHVSSGTATIGSPNPPFQYDPGLPDVVASVDAPAKLQYYSSTLINTAGSYFVGSNLNHQITAATVFYTSSTTIERIGLLALNQNSMGPSNCQWSNQGGGAATSEAGYPGLDSDDVLGWATGVAGNGGFTPYTMEFAMKRVMSIGETTSVYCKAISADPAPASGTFSSGAPDIMTDENKAATLVLVAD